MFSLSHLSAGFIAVLVGYSSSAAIIFQAAASAGASQAQTSSWMWALGLGSGLTTLLLTLRYRQPVLTAWSTPGAALLVTALAGLPMSEAVGVFLFSSALLLVCGLTGWFDHIMRLLPGGLAAAMLGGVLLNFGLDLFVSVQTAPVLVIAMLAVYLALRRRLSRYVIPLCLLAGLALAAGQGLMHPERLDWQVAGPVLMWPTFSFASLIGVGLPLFMVTMASQNVPGVAVLRAHGYNVPASPLVSVTGLAGVLLAPFGGFAFNLAAISAAICMGPEVDAAPERRYRATLWAGLFYILMGLFAATVVSLFAALPKELIMAIAGLALLGTIGNSLTVALRDEQERDAALLTFMVTASGVSLLGIGSAFWGLVIGGGVHWLNSRKRKLEAVS
ncbi:benzoate/H(+) symporter BenE family transporter [Oceanimonas sp. CAM02]|uniref:benzoate/H(+) symporter BenE family transporter n=1 Tax=Oceanimonas sp. CAM02 TaxID=3080336 RepID=UPI0029366F37|nr:benzoate/H(+) symporter BenE family transporter [Oceanimonas sp. CAM02]MDV2856359.1 benzoate/H(+) symporter BenE family transporter [Oceanimonas sp. CAM02]